MASISLSRSYLTANNLNTISPFIYDYVKKRLPLNTYSKRSIKISISNSGVYSQDLHNLFSTYRISSLFLSHSNVNSGCLYNILNEKYSSSLRKLCVKSCGIDSTSIKNINHCPYLSYVNLSRNKIDAEGCKFISSCKNIKKINLSFSSVGDEGASYILSNTNFLKVNLSSNHITSEGLKNLYKNKSILHLDLSYNNLGRDNLITYLSKGKSIMKLNIEGNNLEKDDLKELLMRCKSVIKMGSNKNKNISLTMNKNLYVSSLMKNNRCILNNTTLESRHLVHNQHLLHIIKRKTKKMFFQG
jgi:hypothetical protein